MLEFAASEFSLGALQEDKLSLRDHLSSQWRQTGVKPKLLEEAKEIPSLAAHVWLWFIELHNERHQLAMGVSQITHRDITDWAQAYGIKVLPWERRALKRIDNLFLTKKEDEES